jgi:hypothetical protein
MTDKVATDARRRRWNPFLAIDNLLPLQVSHVNALRQFQSPFLDGRAANLADLAFAVIVCTRSLDDFVFLGNSGKMADLFVEYRQHFARIGAERAMAEFRAYIEAGVSTRAVVEALDVGCGPAPPLAVMAPPPVAAKPDRN